MQAIIHNLLLNLLLTAPTIQQTRLITPNFARHEANINLCFNWNNKHNSIPKSPNYSSRLHPSQITVLQVEEEGGTSHVGVEILRCNYGFKWVLCREPVEDKRVKRVGYITASFDSHFTRICFSVIDSEIQKFNFVYGISDCVFWCLLFTL